MIKYNDGAVIFIVDRLICFEGHRKENSVSLGWQYTSLWVCVCTKQQKRRRHINQIFILRADFLNWWHLSGKLNFNKLKNWTQQNEAIRSKNKFSRHPMCGFHRWPPMYTESFWDVSIHHDSKLKLRVTETRNEMKSLPTFALFNNA